jgi:Protein of unknown function (DUF2946)
MSKKLYRAQRKLPAPRGAWLAFLALAVQVLLPFLVAYDIALLSSPAYAGVTVICSADGTHGTTPAQSAPDQQGHHVACPLCTAMAAGQAFTAITPVAMPLPQPGRGVKIEAGAMRPSAAVTAAFYHPRGPPSFG